MPRIGPNRPNIPLSTLKGAEIKPENKVVSTKSHEITLAAEAGGHWLPDLKLERRNVTDPGAKSKIIDESTIDLSTVATGADFKKLMDGLIETNKAFLNPTKTAFLASLPEGERSNFSYINIVGRRNEQFFDEVSALASKTGLTGDEGKAARKAVNFAHRDAFRGRAVDFDKADTGSYWSYGSDKPFVHVFEKMLASLPEGDPKRVPLQNQIDYIFTHKYVDAGSVKEENAEKSLGLIAIDKDSRNIVSMVKSTENSQSVRYETLKLPASLDGANAEHAGKDVYRDGDNYFFQGSTTPMPAELADKLIRSAVSKVVFRRSDSEQIRSDFKFDWNGNRMVDVASINTGWWGHCDIKATMETLLADMKGSKGVTEYRSDSDSTTEFSRKMQLEALAALLNFGDSYLSTSGGRGARFGHTGFAGARFDDRPTQMLLNAGGRKLPFTIRLNSLSEKDDPTKNVVMSKAFALKIADDKQESFTDNDAILRTEKGDINFIDGSGRKLEGSTDGYTFDDRGRPVELKQPFVIDLANVADDAEKILIGSELKSVGGRSVTRFYLDPKTKELSEVPTTFEKNDEGNFVAKEATARSLGNLSGVELGREMQAGDDLAGKIAMLEAAVRQGDKIATDSDTKQEVWNGEVHSIKMNTEWRSDDGQWERVTVNVDATFGNNKFGKFLHKLDDEGNVIESHELSAAVDFYWQDRPRIAPLVNERGNWFVNKAMHERGVLDTGDGLMTSLAAMTDLSDLVYLGLKADKEPLYTIVHDGKRLVYEDKAAWEADVKKLKGEDVVDPEDGGTTDPTKVVAKRTPDLAIPDADPAGVADTVSVDAAGKIKDISIDIDLKHTYVGDLQLVLVAPGGDEVTLHKRGGRSRDDIVGTYGTGGELKAHDDLASLVGKDAKGDWNLKVVDMAGQDVGTLKSWALNIELEGE